MQRKSNGHWEQKDIVVEQTLQDDPKFKFSLTIDQFVFENGNTAKPKANVTIEYNHRFLRIPLDTYMSMHNFFKADEACMLAIEHTVDDVKRMCDEHEAMVKANREREIKEHQEMIENLGKQNKNKNVGTGLSRFSKKKSNK